MKLKLVTFLLCLFSGNSIAQIEAELEDLVMISPIVWGNVVYIEASSSTNRQLLEKFRAEISKSSHHCNSKYDDYENWYCDKEPELVFRALDGYGKKRDEAVLCRRNKFFNEYKYLNKEMFIQYGCLVASWELDKDIYEFHTTSEWFGDE